MNRTGTTLGKLFFPEGRIINQINHGAFKGKKKYYTFPQVSKIIGTHRIPSYIKVTDHKAKVSYTVNEVQSWDKVKKMNGWRFQVIKQHHTN